MSETWYHTRKYSSEDKINLVQVERSTESSIWINGRRQARGGSWDNYFQTWQEAHEYLLDRASARLQSARAELQKAQAHEGNVRGMVPPLPANQIEKP